MAEVQTPVRGAELPAYFPIFPIISRICDTNVIPGVIPFVVPHVIPGMILD